MWGLRGEMERNHPLEPFKGGRPMVSCQPAPDLGPFLITCHSHPRGLESYYSSLPWVSLVEAMVQSCSLGFSPF